MPHDLRRMTDLSCGVGFDALPSAPRLPEHPDQHRPERGEPAHLDGAPTVGLAKGRTGASTTILARRRVAEMPT
jgi:hypothetical protein